VLDVKIGDLFLLYACRAKAIDGGATEAQHVQGRKKTVTRTVHPRMDTRRIRRSVQVLHNEPGRRKGKAGKARQVAQLA
jgi:hypothetical protein